MEYCDSGMDFIAMEFENEYLWGRAMARPYRVGFWMGVYDNCNFCRDDVHIVPTSEWEIFPSLGGCP